MISADPELSQIAGNVGSDVLIDSNMIWNATTDEWDSYDKLIYPPFMAFGGWQAAVTGGTGVNPYRFSHLSNKELRSNLFSPREADDYLAGQENSLNAPNVALDMRLPAYFSYTETLEVELSKALAGAVAAQQALGTTAAA